MGRPLDLRLTEAAEADLAGIWATLAIEASAQIATRFVNALQTKLEKLRHFPLSGTGREALAPGLRAVFHASYAIYYLVADDAVIVVRVLHGARDIAAIADRGGLV